MSSGRWHKDGPTLPIEFARRSSNGTRLTLAVTPLHGEWVRSYWALSGESTVPKARENLRLREGTENLKNIFAIDKGGQYWGYKQDPEPRQDILHWLNERSDLDAVVWTGLKANWPEDEDLTMRTVDAYVRQQSLKDRAGIKNYVRRTPSQVDTTLRREIEKAYGWTRIPIPASCFEDGIAELGAS